MRRAVLLILLVQLAVGPAWAQTSQPVLHKLPVGKSLQLKSETLRVYTLEEFKVILQIYNDYKKFYSEKEQLRAANTHLLSIESEQVKSMKSKDKVISIQELELGRLTKKWTEENRLRHVAENKPKFGSWIAWGTAGAMAIVAGVLVGLFITEK